MMDLESVPWYTLALPAALLVGSWTVSKILRFSYLATLLVSTLPLGLPFVELPLSKEFMGLKPELLIGGGWLFLFACALGWVVARPVVVGGIKSFGLLKVVYVVALGAALLVVAVLVSRPELMNTYAPGWKGGAGVVLLCASLLSMSLALARIFRAAVMFSVWAMVSLVLASEIFLDKLPQDVVREDLRQIESLVPPRLIDSAIEQLNVTVPDGAAKLKAFVLGGGSSTGFPFSGERGLAGRLQHSLRNSGVDVEVHDASIEGASIYDLHRIAREKLVPAKPDLVLVVGWSPDSEVGVNSYGFTGLTEREAIEKVHRAAQMREFPFAESVLTSTLYRFFRGTDNNTPLREQPIARVPVDEYRVELAQTVRELREAGAKVVLVSEPTVDQSGLGYRDAMQQVASSGEALFIPLAEDMSRQQDPLVFSRGKILSDRGYSTVAESMAEYLRAFVGAEVVPKPQGDSDPRPIAAPQHPEQPKFSELGAQGHQVKLVVKPSEINGDLVFKMRVAEKGTRFYRVTFSANGEFIGDKRLDSRDSVRVRFRLPEHYRSLPIVELGLRTVASPPLESDRVGSSTVYVPVPVSVSTEPGKEAVIKAGEITQYSWQPYSALAVDPRSGDVISSVHAGTAGEFSAWSRTLAWGVMVVGAVSASAEEGESGALLRSISGGVALPAPGERAAFVGLIGGLKGEVVIKNGQGPVSLTLGSPVVSAYNRFELQEVLVNDQPLSWFRA
jgi:hypothetical protein